MKYIELKETAVFTGAGALGGLFAWLQGLTSSATQSVPAAIATAMLGGALAAGVGIYLLAASDTAQLRRCLFFAVLLGISWEPVLASGKNLVTQTVLKQDVADLKQATNALNAAGGGASTEEIAKATAQATEVVRNLPAIAAPELKTEAREALLKALSTLQAAVPANPEAVHGVSEVARTAAEVGTPQVKSAAVVVLESLATDAQLKPEVNASAKESLNGLR